MRLWPVKAPASRTGLTSRAGLRLGRTPPVDPGRLPRTIRRQLSVREAARELGVSPSSYARLVRGLGNGSGRGGPDAVPETSAAAVL